MSHCKNIQGTFESWEYDIEYVAPPIYKWWMLLTFFPSFTCSSSIVQCLEMTTKRKLIGRLVPCRCFRGEEEVISVLDYSHCSLQQVPKEIFSFERTLEELYLDANQIEELPKVMLKWLASGLHQVFSAACRWEQPHVCYFLYRVTNFHPWYLRNVGTMMQKDLRGRDRIDMFCGQLCKGFCSLGRRYYGVCAKINVALPWWQEEDAIYNQTVILLYWHPVLV